MQNEDMNRNGSDVVDEGDEDVTSEETPMEEDPGDTVVLSESDYSDNVGDISVEINVEELVAKVESAESDDVKRKKEVRQRLEELAEQQQMDDTYAVDFDKD